MRIKQIKINELLDFVDSQEYQNSKIVPITRSRANSQVLNPRAKTTDVVLTVAYNAQNEIIAYVGALPDLVNKKIRIAWNSCWYASSVEGRTIALPLFLQFVKDYNNRVIFQDLTPHTTKILQTLPNFKLVTKKQGIRVFIRSILYEVLVQKYAKVKNVKFLFQLFENIINLYIDYRWKKWGRRINTQIHIERIYFVDAEAEKFIKLQNKQDLIQREKAELDWILNKKWVEEGDINEDVYKGRYHFTSSVRHFQYHLLKFKSFDKLIGVVLLRKRDGNIETPYFFIEIGNENMVALSLLKYSIKIKGNTITTYNQTLFESLVKLKYPAPYRRKLFRDIVASTELINEIEEFGIIQDGDGDVVFT